MLWMIPVAGAALGALRARQQGGSMLRGGVTGGLLGAGAAYAAPALMGGAGAASAAPMAAAGTTSGGLLSTALPALNAASQAQGLLGGQQMAPQMPQQQITGPQTLADIASQGQQQIGGLMDDAMKRRQMNQQIISQMMGRNYG